MSGQFGHALRMKQPLRHGQLVLSRQLRGWPRGDSDSSGSGSKFGASRGETEWAIDLSSRIGQLEARLQREARQKAAERDQLLITGAIACAALGSSAFLWMFPQSVTHNHNVEVDGGGGGGGWWGRGGGGSGGGGGGGAGGQVRTVVKELDHAALDRRIGEHRKELESSLKSSVRTEVDSKLKQTIGAELDKRVSVVHEKAKAESEKKLQVGRTLEAEALKNKRTLREEEARHEKCAVRSPFHSCSWRAPLLPPRLLTTQGQA